MPLGQVHPAGWHIAQFSNVYLKSMRYSVLLEFELRTAGRSK